MNVSCDKMIEPILWAKNDLQLPASNVLSADNTLYTIISIKWIECA